MTRAIDTGTDDLRRASTARRRDHLQSAGPPECAVEGMYGGFGELPELADDPSSEWYGHRAGGAFCAGGDVKSMNE